MQFKGIIASPGIALGTAYVYKEEEQTISQQRTGSVEEEISKFAQAVEASKVEIQALMESTKESLSEDHALIFQAHLEVLEDPSIIDETVSAIKSSEQSAEYALKTVRDVIVDMFAAMDDEYLRERSNDILDVTNRIIGHLQGKAKSALTFQDKTVIVANDLTPSFTATLDREKVVAFVTYAGGATSHTAIMARSMGIPAIVGVKAEGQIESGQSIIVDGEIGEVLVEPNQETLTAYESKFAGLAEIEAHYDSIKEIQVKASNGEPIALLANIGSPQDLAMAIEKGAEGVGLFRSEFLFMDAKEAPSEEEQFIAYKTVLEAMEGKPVTIRTLDIGGDKEIPYLKMPKEENPFLGYRAIRICLEETNLFRTQLRALLRASAFGKLKIMIPLITSVDEIQATKRILAEEEENLRTQGHVIGEYQVGIMVETPASVFIAEQLAVEVDFFSIGTNDLIQYVLVVDRMNEKIAHYYNPLHPAVLSAIQHVLDVGKKCDVDVSMCGEMAGDAKATAKLAEMGLRSFSMSASSIPKVKDVLLNL